jgi:hypothetical protein
MLDRHCSLSSPTLPLPLLARVVGRATTLPDSVAKLQPASHLFSELSLYRDAYLLRMPCSFLFWSVRSCFYLALVAIEHPRLRLYRCRGGVSSKIGIRQPQSNHIEMDPLPLLGILGNLLSPCQWRHFRRHIMICSLILIDCISRDCQELPHPLAHTFSTRNPPLGIAIPLSSQG